MKTVTRSRILVGFWALYLATVAALVVLVLGFALVAFP